MSGKHLRLGGIVPGVCLALWVWGAPLAAQLEDPLKPPTLPAPAPESGAALLGRLTRILEAPDPDMSPAQVRRRLDELIRLAGELAQRSEPGPQRQEALSIQMQGLYVRVARWPQDPDAQRLLLRLRRTALEARNLDGQAAAQADFWLTMGELLELNQSEMAKPQRRNAAAGFLRDYLEAHPEGPASEAAASMLADLISDGVVPGLPEPQPDPDPLLPAAYTLGPRITAPDGSLRYTIRSRYQSGLNTLRILMPDAPPQTGPVKILLVLPVEAELGRDFGDGLEEVRRLDLHNRLGLVAVCPTLSRIPWYGNHPTDSEIHQESYMVKGVLPALEEILGSPSKSPRGVQRLLVGFSKSGWGAVHLLLAYPETFHAAAAWDAPLMMEIPDRYQIQEIFPNVDHFRRFAALPARLRAKASMLRKRPRLVLAGWDFFKDDMNQAHALLEEIQVPHIWHEQARSPHRWNSGWMEGAVTDLVKMADEKGQ